MLSTTYIRASTFDVITLTVIGSNIIFQEVGYFENSTNLLVLEQASPLLLQVAI
jgi:hypothetical protein